MSQTVKELLRLAQEADKNGDYQKADQLQRRIYAQSNGIENKLYNLLENVMSVRQDVGALKTPWLKEVAHKVLMDVYYYIDDYSKWISNRNNKFSNNTKIIRVADAGDNLANKIDNIGGVIRSVLSNYKGGAELGQFLTAKINYLIPYLRGNETYDVRTMMQQQNSLNGQLTQYFSKLKATPDIASTPTQNTNKSTQKQYINGVLQPTPTQGTQTIPVSNTIQNTPTSTNSMLGKPYHYEGDTGKMGDYINADWAQKGEKYYDQYYQHQLKQRNNPEYHNEVENYVSMALQNAKNNPNIARQWLINNTKTHSEQFQQDTLNELNNKMSRPANANQILDGENLPYGANGLSPAKNITRNMYQGNYQSPMPPLGTTNLPSGVGWQTTNNPDIKYNPNTNTYYSVMYNRYWQNPNPLQPDNVVNNTPYVSSN